MDLSHLGSTVITLGSSALNALHCETHSSLKSVSLLALTPSLSLQPVIHSTHTIMFKRIAMTSHSLEPGYAGRRRYVSTFNYVSIPIPSLLR